MNLDEQEIEAKEIRDRLQSLYKSRLVMSQGNRLDGCSDREIEAHTWITEMIRQASSRMEQVTEELDGPWI